MYKSFSQENVPDSSYELPYWQDCKRGQVPENAVLGGNDNGTLYIARAFQDGELIPGKLHVKYGSCYVPHKKEEVKCREYQVLCSNGICHLKWITMGKDKPVPEGLVQGGNAANGDPYYIGRVKHRTTVTCGKVTKNCENLMIAYGDLEYHYENFDVLVCILPSHSQPE